eukprot:9869126-Heterocapsa_arctica.AAC.1
MYNAVEPDVKALQNALTIADQMMVEQRCKLEDALERSEVQMAEYRNKAVEVLKDQRDESRKAYNASRASYEEQILNMNVSHQLEN